ncbi:hypothetical protein WJX72_001415 [[Myrmecia] bisecta]|uniref:GPI inositol-deacylase n=1 Tax=[Myrmecia] bisecta TaxID=41462 RepID=A0AAW1Q6I5_9CHLO
MQLPLTDPANCEATTLYSAPPPTPKQVGAAEKPTVEELVAATLDRVQEPGQHSWEEDVLLWRRPAACPNVQASPDAPPLIILPGFGNNTADYVEPAAQREHSLVASLRDRGFSVYVVDVERQDWLKVDLIGHSAGGWLGRAFLADPAYFVQEGPDRQCHHAVRTLVTLGTPHSAPPAGKARDMTGGALTWVHSNWPGACFAEQQVKYVCVAGRTVRGDRAAQRRSLGKYAYGSYTQVCGDGDGVEGDSVVPHESAHLEGATNVLLDGVFHSMTSIGAYKNPSEFVWYGSAEVVDHWAHHLVD